LLKRNEWLALFERILYRGASSATSLLIAYLFNPSELGLYATGFLFLNMVLSVVEAPMRQNLASALQSRRVPRSLLKTIIIWGASGSAALAFLFTAWSISANQNIDSLYKLFPLVLVPSIVALGIKFNATLELHLKWSRIFLSQLIALTISLLISVPLLPIFKAGAANLQTLIGETVLVICLWISSKNLRVANSDQRIKLSMQNSVANFLGWCQGQAERIPLAFLGLTHLLGLYSLSFSIARTLSDTISAGLNNLLRASFSRSASVDEQRISLNRTLALSLKVSFAQQAFVILIGPLAIFTFLGESWRDASYFVVLLSLGIITSGQSWTLSNYLVLSGHARKLIKWQIFAISLSLICGILFVISPITATITLLCRDALIYWSRLRLVEQEGIVVSISPKIAMSAASVLAAFGALYVWILRSHFV